MKNDGHLRPMRLYETGVPGFAGNKAGVSESVSASKNSLSLDMPVRIRVLTVPSGERSVFATSL